MGSFSILNNISALNGRNQLNINSANLSRTLDRLSSGKRINSGADDAAGLQIADSLRANSFALNQAARNANDGNSLAQIADGALQEITNLLTRSITLAEEASTGTIDGEGRLSLNNEFAAVQQEIGRIVSTTNFNGTMLLTDTGTINGTLHVYVGDINGPSSIAVTMGTIAVDGDGNIASFRSDADTNMSALKLTDTDSASTALTTIKNAISSVSNMRASIGAGMNRLQSSILVLQTQSQNTQAAESSIRDANIAEEVSNMTRYQILAQSGMAALSQANSSAQSILSLLK
jgi:flagellin